MGHRGSSILIIPGQRSLLYGSRGRGPPSLKKWGYQWPVVVAYTCVVPDADSVGAERFQPERDGEGCAPCRSGTVSDCLLLPAVVSVPQMAGMVESRMLRVVLIGLGWVFVGIGFVGIVLPLVPTTGPVLLAAFLFSMSSARFDCWLTSHPVFGPIVCDWRAGHGFTARLKVIAVSAIALTFSVTVVFAIDSTPVRVLLIGLAIGLVTYILRLPTKQPVPSTRASS